MQSPKTQHNGRNFLEEAEEAYFYFHRKYSGDRSVHKKIEKAHSVLMAEFKQRSQINGQLLKTLPFLRRSHCSDCLRFHIGADEQCRECREFVQFIEDMPF